MIITPIKTRIFFENENLEKFILEYIPAVQKNSIIVVTSKIVALAEGRTAVVINEEEKEALIRQESEWMLRTKYTWLTIKDGTVLTVAGIDESNANGKVILLPKNIYYSAEELRSMLRSKYSTGNIGILITDSRTIPLRTGIGGIALGYAGFKGMRNYIGTPDLFGRIMTMSRTNVADSLASAAVICMGEGAEQQPLAVITDPPVEWTDDPIDPDELRVPPEDDLYRPFFESLTMREDGERHPDTPLNDDQ